MRHGGDGNDMAAFLLLESVFCDCDSLCECGWDDPVEMGDEEDDDPS